ncbi:glycogen synthase GlgA [Celerinatantimonas sp. YJH-8]|uniref:glycogen synthase GlgA n=1 Tax=Celerinatantimonas sp. YJH-8 TaxID=3228714 RepID=UPI0038C84F40
MDNPLKILFVSSEIESLVKTGGLADVAKSLPLALQQQGHQVTLMMPYYRTMARHDEVQYITDIYVENAHGAALRVPVLLLKIGEINVYCLEQNNYFDRPQLYSEGEYGYPDNGERFAFFSAAALACSAALDLDLDIIHCNDWHTGLVPYLLKTRYAEHPRLHRVKTVLTIHNAVFQGIFEHQQFSFLGQDIIAPLTDRLLDGYQCINMLKSGIRYADKITAVSPNYAQELLTRLGAHGLHEFFQQRQNDLVGIINGCDYNDWNPATDPLLPSHYQVDDLTGKSQCKQALQQAVNLPVIQQRPIFGMVCRLTEQKGFYLLLPALEQFLHHHVQVIIVGTGDSRIAEQLMALQARFSDKLVFINAYDNKLAHLVEAGADFFLMPSLFEPCGLNQMYSLAYATLPIVRGVGGLKDTVRDYDADPSQANGFIFYQPESGDLLNILRRALLLYLEDPEQMQQMQYRAMQQHFSWQHAARLYSDLYREALL